MATGNSSQRHNDVSDYPFHDADDNPMSTIMAPTTEIVPQEQLGTEAVVTDVAQETDLRDGRTTTPSSDNESIEIVRQTHASAARKATASGEKASAANKPPERPRQILMPMTTEEGFRTLITAMNEQRDLIRAQN
jgi:metal-dependent HD superfamily phosphatase/phosphodiesterase